MVLFSARLGAFASDWLPFSTAFVVGVLATVVRLCVPDLNLVLVILSAVAIILPGYTISLGAGELVASYIESGAAKLMSGLNCLFKQVAGGWLGVAAASFVIPAAATEQASPVDPVWMWLLVPVLIVGVQNVPCRQQTPTP
jgi:hypothetical protein